MTGAVIINDGNVWSANFAFYDPIILTIRNQFEQTYPATDNGPFAPLDDGMDYIALDEIDVAAFVHFLKLCTDLRDSISNKSQFPDLHDLHKKEPPHFPGRVDRSA